MTETSAQPAQSKLPLEVVGVSVTPHNRAESMRYMVEPGKANGALVRLFLRNTAPPASGRSGMVQTSEVLFNGFYPIRLLMEGAWAWHDTPNLWQERDTFLPPGAVTVWTFNAIVPRWSVGSKFMLTIEDWSRGARESFPVAIENPQVYLSAVTFLGTEKSVQPDRVIFHVANRGKGAVKITGARLYLPETSASYRVLKPQPPLTTLKTFPADGVIPPGEKGGAMAITGPLPLTYTALEVSLTDAEGKPFTLWGRLRIKKETFDISGGWIVTGTRDNSLSVTHEAYLKTLKRMHINTGHFGLTPGYTDQTGPNGLYTRYPIKFFGTLEPFAQYDTDENLPRIHAAERLGEPQLAFSKDQMLPQEVWKALEPYAATRFATTVTLNDESNWRYYAGLSDYPHHDNYRVTAPSVDAWRKYDRWDGATIGWGAPLETIGDLCRSLRELSRPAPTAYWSQGAGSGWDVYDGRLRTSPTPEELRLQAYHALATRITSLYWFNLSLSAVVKFRDTIDEITRIGREMRMLEEFYLEGDAYGYRRTKRNGKPDWDLASITAPQGALLFALDLDYTPDLKEKVFRFGAPRPVKFTFALPAYLRSVEDVFRVDADGVHTVSFRVSEQGVEITDTISKVGIYVAAPGRAMRARLEAKRRSLVAEENALGFDPARNDGDFAALKAIARARD
jgi:hypothetical protein